MTKLTPDLAAEIQAACQAGCGEIAAALGRTLDTDFEMHIGELASLADAGLAEELAAAGLAVALRVGEQAAVVVLPESCGLIPAWYAAPDATGRSKLTTLAQELGMLLLPDTIAVDEFDAGRSVDLMQWLTQGGLAADTRLLPLTLSDSTGRQGVAQFIWPLENPTALLAAVKANGAAAAPAATSPPQPAVAQRISAAAVAPQRSEHELPSYARSLLRISVPVTVTLAEKRQPVSRIVELGPGAIIQFDKACEELLELEVGGHKIGMGEAVKVGDKFGLRITSMIVPEERYVPVRRAASS